MMNEKVHHSIDPLPTYGECFARSGKDFSAAARDWVDARIPASGLPLWKSVYDQMQEWAIDAVGQYDARILSNHFETFAKGIGRASLVIFWSEGAIDAQRSKLAVVKGSLRDTERLPQSVDLVGLQKMDFVDTAMKHVHLKESELRQKDLLQGGQVPVVIIEDKISNMMSFMRRYIDEESISPAGDRAETSEIGTSTDFEFKEELLDGQFIEFEEKLAAWKEFVERHTSEFSQFKFLYVLPDKPVAEISQLRKDRVYRIITETNAILQQEGPTDVHFFRIDGTPATTIDQTMPPNSVVISDVDGPLVSQQRILATREAMIQKAMAKHIDELFDQYYGITALPFLYFISNPDLRSIAVAEKIGTDESTLRRCFTGRITEEIPIAKVPTDFRLRMILEKKPVPDSNSLTLRVILPNANIQETSSFDVNIDLKQIGETLEALGCIFPDRKIAYPPFI